MVIISMKCIPIISGKTKCYECDSRLHVECKSTFGYTDQQAEHSGIMTTCNDGQMCRKLTFTDFSGRLLKPTLTVARGIRGRDEPNRKLIITEVELAVR